MKPLRPALATGAIALCASILQLAVLTPAKSEQAPAPVIVDTAGDANSLGTVGMDDRDTRPASDDRADILKIWPETTYKTEVVRGSDGSVQAVRHTPLGLRINVQTTAKANPATGPSLWFTLPVVAGECEISFMFFTRGPLSVQDVPERAEIDDTSFDGVGFVQPGCLGAELTSPQFQLQFDGPITRLDFPFTALKGTRAEELIAPGVELTGSSVLPDFVRVREIPTGGLLLLGAVDGTGALPSPFVIGSDVPADIDCSVSPSDPACAG